MCEFQSTPYRWNHPRMLSISGNWSEMILCLIHISSSCSRYFSPESITINVVWALHYTEWPSCSLSLVSSQIMDIQMISDHTILYLSETSFVLWLNHHNHINSNNIENSDFSSSCGGMQFRWYQRFQLNDLKIIPLLVAHWMCSLPWDYSLNQC